eukprot:GEMP01077453.1.p1 GENE.GEMP01077453.1~~GEMP01077453.1.p1  ORF type:complete len:148 (+),score=33.10 GEMP01077453.1:116-559(+)
MSPSQISSVEMKHPLIPVPRRVTLTGWNPRFDEKPKADCLGQDPGKAPQGSKDCVLTRSPLITMGPKTNYIVGMQRSKSDVQVRNVWRMTASGALFDPRWTMSSRTALPLAKNPTPAPNRYDQSKNLRVDGTKSRSPSFSFGSARRW